MAEHDAHDAAGAIEQAVEQGAAATRLAPSQFAQDLAAALVDPVCRALLVAAVRDAVREEIAAERARNLSASNQGTPPPVRGSTKTAWVGESLRRQQAQQQGSQ